MNMLKIAIRTICISVLFGVLYLPVCDLWDRHVAWGGGQFHEFSGCQCIAQTRHGEAVLRQRPPVVGKEKAAVIASLGKPDGMRDLTKEFGSDPSSQSQVDEIWFYNENVVVHFHKGQCIGAWGVSCIYH